MDKKDIYEHLAKIYWDASLKRKKRTKERPGFKILFFISLFFISFGFTFLLLISQNKKQNLNSEFVLLLQTDVTKINFNFVPVKKEIYSIDLNKLDLTRFKALEFSVKKSNVQDNIVLKVEFANAFAEKSEVYYRDIPHNKWQNTRIAFLDFKKISDWSKMKSISFIIEEWNTRNKNGVIYIDDVKFLR